MNFYKEHNTGYIQVETMIKNTWRWLYSKQYFDRMSCLNPETIWEIMCREGE